MLKFDMLPELFSCRIEREREEMRVTKTFLKSTLEWNNYKPLLLHWSRGDMFLPSMYSSFSDSFFNFAPTDNAV